MGKNASAKGKAPIKDKSNKRKREAEEPKAGGAVSLFGGVKDAELDDVFAKSSTFAQPVTAPAPVASSSKVQLEAPAAPASKKGKKAAVPEPESESESSEEEAEAEAEEDSDDEEVAGEVAGDEGEFEDDGSSAASDEEFVHESLKAKAEKKAAKKAAKQSKYVPPAETQADKDRRTVFVGNLPIEAAKSKSVLHQLRAHLLSFVPSAKIESVRFRSVPFAAPTAALPTDDPEKDENQRVKREKERAAAWREQKDKEEAGAAKPKSKQEEEEEKAQVYIDSKGKRKVAFIKKDFHTELGSCNAYVVFAHPHPDRSANVAPILDPFEAASTVISAANGSAFLDRHIRVDSLRLPSAVALATATNALGKRDAWLPAGTDPKKSLFVGGLDYAAKEEDLRMFFEEIVKAEKGAREEGSYVSAVRIVRDKETQLGKGFGYVHFADRESVDEILAMDAAKIKFAKRTIRVQKCKTLPTSSTLTNTIKSMANPKSKSKTDKAAKPRHTGPIPKGNPKLGEKIKDLSKEERKAVKSSDADRQARRLAKKRAQNSMDKDKSKGKVKLTLTKGEKERTTASKKPKAKKGKIRGPGAIAKMKGSRA
ncbi:hypothetical protein IAT38_001195 [Cryptococcus sp. DSM 104549]